MTIDSLYEIFLKHPQVSTDTRAIKKDAVFFALRGETFDGNQFAKDALEKGAAFAVIDGWLFFIGRH